mgnify:CR=1 FL=1
MEDSDVNSKVEYLLKLLRNKHTPRQASVIPPPTDLQQQQEDSVNSQNNSDLDSDFEDVIGSLAMAQLELPLKLALNDNWFEPTRVIVEDNYLSDTVCQQQDTEIAIVEEFHKTKGDLEFDSGRHLQYINNALIKPMPGYFVGLDANHTWMVYWLVNAHSLIVNKEHDQSMDEYAHLVTEKIKSCIIDNGKGGIGGGRNQIGHLASAYAAILALCSIKQYELIDEIRSNLYNWIMSLKLPNGSFRMHQNGESDTRSTYCALVIASLLNMDDARLTANCREWLNTCQTFEGGFSGTPCTEAHGGYTFCALASYFLLYSDKWEFYSQESFDLESLIRWTCMEQHQLEGGLCGRTNKLVDACYSFWVGGVFAMLEPIIHDNTSLFSRLGLKSYILRCCQAATGGFRDKPGKSVDFYHTNYTLCGLSICEHEMKFDNSTQKLCYSFESQALVEAPFTEPVNSVFGLPLGIGEAAHKHFLNVNKQ